MAQQFATGDRVIVTNLQATGVPKGTVGTVVRAFAHSPEVCDVQFDGQKRVHAVLAMGLVPAPSLDSAPAHGVVQKPADAWRAPAGVETGDKMTTIRTIGDHVFVTADNYGSMATIIDFRESEGSPASHYKVRTDTGDEFWAYDFEVDDPLPPRPSVA